MPASTTRHPRIQDATPVQRSLFEDASVPIKPYTGEMMTVENRLNRRRPTELRNQEVGGGAVAVNNSSPNEVVDGRVKTVASHQHGERLDRKTQILFPNDDCISQGPPAMTNSIHHRAADEKLQDALEGESLPTIHS